MAKKRVYKFECPNCGCHNQNKLLADKVDDQPRLLCGNCESLFSSPVIDRIYYMGYQQGRHYEAHSLKCPQCGKSPEEHPHIDCDIQVWFKGGKTK